MVKYVRFDTLLSNEKGLPNPELMTTHQRKIGCHTKCRWKSIAIREHYCLLVKATKLADVQCFEEAI
jgi:hypothetical protein